MRKVVIILVVLLNSCAFKISSSKNYRVAIQDLEYIDKKEHFFLIERENIKLHSPLKFYKDTIDLLEKETMGFKNPYKNRLYIYTFNKSNIIRRVECDSNWRVLDVSLISEAY